MGLSLARGEGNGVTCQPAVPGLCGNGATAGDQTRNRIANICFRRKPDRSAAGRVSEANGMAIGEARGTD